MLGAATDAVGVLAASGSLDLSHRTGDSTPARRMVAAGIPYDSVARADGQQGAGASWETQ